MLLKTLVLSLCAVLVFACGSQAVKDETQAPAWLLGESKDFPRKQYLFGVGEADSMASAKSRARAEIAKVFTVDIQAHASDSSVYENLNLADGVGATESLAVSQSIATQTKQRVQGIEIPEVWQDKSSKRYYALAVLPRQKTASSLRKDIASLDMATETVLSSAKASGSLFQKIKLSSKAIDLQSKRSLLADQLAVVSLTGNDLSEKYPLQKLVVDRSELLSRITVRTEAEGFESVKMQDVLANALANDGLTVTDSGEHLIVANLTTTGLEPRGAWFYNKASLTVSVFDRQKNSLGGKTWDYKVSATDAALSEIRVIEQASAILEKELAKEFFSLMN